MLTREEIVQETRYYYDPFWMGSSPAYTTLQQEENYFLMGSDARIEGFESPKDMIELSFSNHFEKVKRYIKTNRLRVENRVDMALVVEYYNSLEDSN